MTNDADFYQNTIVIGPNSSIAKYVLGKLTFDRNRLFGVYNTNLDSDVKDYFLPHHLVSFRKLKGDFSNLNLYLPVDRDKNVLILNFSGVFGKVNTFTRSSDNEIIETLSDNLEVFLFAARIIDLFSFESLMISFCGSGVGGANLDDSSLGYLGAKASISILNEALDKQLMTSGKRLALLSPGPFPSRMQNAVALASNGSVTDSRRKQANLVLEKGAKSPERILKLLGFLIENPNLAGGRLWSAQFDDIENLDVGEDFGRLRRVY